MQNWEQKFRAVPRRKPLPRTAWEQKFRAAPVSFRGEADVSWPSVIAAFPRVQTQWEARLPYMYTDSLGLVTTGIGNLIDQSCNEPGRGDPWYPALAMPWVLKSDMATRATPEEIAQDWQTVKAAHVPGRYDAPVDAGITQLRLPQAYIDELVNTKRQQAEAQLLKSLPKFRGAPADAQMATLGMAWAMGSAFIPVRGFKSFQAAFNAGDWAGAKAQSHFGGEAAQRRVGHDLMWDNAVAVAAGKLDPGKLWYPGSVPPGASSGPGVGGLVAGVLIAATVGGVAYHYRDEWVPPAREAYATASKSAAKGWRDTRAAVAGFVSSPKQKRLRGA